MKRDRSGDVIGGQLVHRHAYSPAGGCVSLPRLVAEREPKRAGDGGTAGEWATPNRMPIQQRPTNAQGRERRDSWPRAGSAAEANGQPAQSWLGKSEQGR